MAETAFQNTYRDEYIAGFEQRQTLLRETVTTESVVKGNTAYFLVADSGDAVAVTRGTNGLIPRRSDSLTQTSATLVESHDLVTKTGFNIFASQGDQRRIMQETSYGTINRKIDTSILTALSGATNDTGAAATGSLSLILHAKTILGNNEVPTNDGNVSAIISPALEAYLMQAPEFTSADYINDKPFSNAKSMFRWFGVNFIVHPNLTGKGTALEYCYMYHKSALGHAIDTGGIKVAVGYDEEQDYSYARATVYEGAALLQNSGVVVIKHDGSGFAAS